MAPFVMVLLGLIMAAPCWAAPEVCAIEVAGDSVTVGDLLSPGMQADGRTLQTVVISGLRPGERRVLTPAEVELRLREAGVDARAHGWKWADSLLIVRKAQVVAAADLVAAGEAAIRCDLRLQPGDEAAIERVAAPRPLLAPVGPIALRATVRAPTLRGGLWTATVVVEAGGAGEGRCPEDEAPTGRRTWADCVIRYRVRVMGDVLLARSPIKRHDPVTADVAAVERRELTSLWGEAVRKVEDLSGRRAVQGIAAGAVITAELIEAIPVVRRGEALTAVAEMGLVRGAAEVIAQADGGIGEVIPVRIGPRREELLVRITGPGKGEVLR
jgi:flagella basal body P-ring formation protein FlgA